MKVAFCSSEIFPYAKTGGLADVSGALPYALAKEGCTVKVFMPFYKNIKPQEVFDDYGYTKSQKVEFYFIRNDNYFLRDYLYGTPQGDYPDNLERFSFFSHQVLKLLKKLKFSPQIIHSNDWQASLVNIYLKLKYNDDDFFSQTKTVLTIHNLAYQGLFAKDKYPLLGLTWDHFNMYQLEYYGKINLLKGGIVFSDIVNTVSPTYARQIQTAQCGGGLAGALKERKNSLYGVLNAIDYKVWNPQTDQLIYKKYSPKNLSDKYVNKTKFQKEMGLAVDKDTFLLGMVSRLAEQKGVDILCQSLDKLLKNYQLVILGFGDAKYHKILQGKQKKFKKAFSLNLKFDESLAHRIYASCDAFLLPSRFEPCGLSQMISYKYATVPIVHHTGGLCDTVVDYARGGGGFVFHKYSSKELVSTLRRAASVFGKKKEWLKLLKKTTSYNFSWEQAAKKYIEIYSKAGKLTQRRSCSRKDRCASGAKR